MRNINAFISELRGSSPKLDNIVKKFDKVYKILSDLQNQRLNAKSENKHIKDQNYFNFFQFELASLITHKFEAASLLDINNALVSKFNQIIEGTFDVISFRTQNLGIAIWIGAIIPNSTAKNIELKENHGIILGIPRSATTTKNIMIIRLQNLPFHVPRNECLFASNKVVLGGIYRIDVLQVLNVPKKWGHWSVRINSDYDMERERK